MFCGKRRYYVRPVESGRAHLKRGNDTVASMSEEERQVLDHYRQLIAAVEDARAAYYDRDAPVLSDADYDQLYRQLEEFEAKYPQYRSSDSPTTRVGGAASDPRAPPPAYDESG